MDETNLQLFGIALILFGGFIMVGYAAGYPYDNAGYLIALLGLGISIVALLWAFRTKSSPDQTP